MKFSFKNHIVLLVLIVSCSKTFAAKQDSLLLFFEDLMSRTLLVCLQNENPKIIEKLSSKDKIEELELYRNAIKSTNSNFINAVKVVWKLNSEIKFISNDSLEWYITNFPKKYGYLSLSSSQIHSSGAISVGSENTPSFSNLGLHIFLSEKKRSLAFSSFPADEIGQNISKDLKKDNVRYSDHYLSTSKFIYALYRISYFYSDLTKGIRPYLGYRDAINSGGNSSEKASEIKNKTLVARLQDCEKKLDLEKAKKYYPYSLKIVSDEDFDKYLLNKDPNIVCFFVSRVGSSTMGGGGVSMTKIIFMQQVINASDGLINTGFAGSFGLGYKALEGFITMLERLKKHEQKQQQKQEQKQKEE